MALAHYKKSGIVLVVFAVLAAGLGWRLLIAWNTSPRLRGAFTVAAAVLLLWIALWLYPRRAAAKIPGLSPKERFDCENECRKILAQIIGGVLLLAGLYSTARTFDLTEQGQLSDRFTKATEMLGATDTNNNIKTEVRTGAIFAIGMIARDSPKYHLQAMDLLTFYLHKNSLWTDDKAHTDPAPLATDIQAVLTVLANRDVDYEREHDERLGLEGLDLRRAEVDTGNFGDVDLIDSHLEWSRLQGTDFTGAHLRRANLDDAVLRFAVLERADLRAVKLNRADLIAIQARKANLMEADLTDADLRIAHLEEAGLMNAQMHATLTGAHLDRARLNGANLSGAKMADASMQGTHLEGANLTNVVGLSKKQIESACIDARTKLPAEVRRPLRSSGDCH